MRKFTHFLMLLALCFVSSTAMGQAADPDIFRKPLFNMNDYGSKYWRIPALTVAQDGSLVAVVDKRGNALGDLPNTISLMSVKSTDSGKTWSEPVVVAEGNASTGKTYGDAALVTDKNTGNIICMYVGDRGFFASTPSNRAVIYYSVSKDHGKTWSAPKEINSQIYAGHSNWYAAFAGSGRGTQMSDGRIVFVLAVRPNSAQTAYVDNWTIYSDDGGTTWNVSDNRATDVGNEAKTIELANGELLMSIRNPGKGFRRFCKSTDGGKTWGTSYLSKTLIDADCNGDIIRCDYGAKSYLLHSLPNSSANREDVSIFISEDEGATWRLGKQLVDGYSAYSSMVVLPDNSIGVLVEEGKWDSNFPGADGFNLVYYNFSKEWLFENFSKVTVLAPTAEEGTVTIDGVPVTADQKVDMSSKSSFTLLATPAEGYAFVKWIDANGNTISTDTECVIESVNYVTIKAVFVNTTQYCVPDVSTNYEGRGLNAITLTGGKEAFSISGIQATSGTRPVYYDKTSHVFIAEPGATIQPVIDWTGSWMHGYMYIDYNKDYTFSPDIESNGVPSEGSEIVSYTFYSPLDGDAAANGYDSHGNATTNGLAFKNGMPSFALPATLAPGEYRVRFKVDWNSLDPCGSREPTNLIENNGGCVVDFILKIEGETPPPPARQYTMSITTPMFSDGFMSVYVDNVETSPYANTFQVDEGAEIKVVVTPSASRDLNQLLINGVAVNPAYAETTASRTYTYVFNITEDITIAATFKDVVVPTVPTLTYSFTGSGYVEVWSDIDTGTWPFTGAGEQYLNGAELPEGGYINVFAIPQNNETLESITINGEPASVADAIEVGIQILVSESVSVVAKFTGPSTGIEAATAATVAVYAGNGAILINSGAAASANVYAGNGVLVRTASVKEGINAISVPAGFYVVKMGSQAYKVSVK